ncbi:MAG: M20/M25/M40 family metallo-hydrolase [Candidatus Hodarchaeota archaeon]
MTLGILYLAGDHTDRQIISIRGDNHIIDLITQVNESYLKANILKLQSYGTRYPWGKQWEVASWIAQQMKDLGYDVAIQNYDFNEKEWPNVIARKKGNTDPTAIIILLAHFDSISDDPENNAPGADDNGSGIAILLESARILKDIDFNNTLTFSFFSNEETGTAGSNYYAEKAKESGLNIKAAINFDVLGYNKPSSVFPIAAIKAQGSIRHKAKAIYRIQMNNILGLLHGNDAVKVAGKIANEKLAKAVSNIFRQYSDLTVLESIREDCG